MARPKDGPAELVVVGRGDEMLCARRRAWCGPPIGRIRGERVDGLGASSQA